MYPDVAFIVVLGCIMGNLLFVVTCFRSVCQLTKISDLSPAINELGCKSFIICTIKEKGILNIILGYQLSHSGPEKQHNLIKIGKLDHILNKLGAK